MDDFLKYGFYAKGIYRILTKRQMNDRRVIRWIKNEAAAKNLPFRAWLAYLDNYYRDAPIIFKRKRTRDGKWKEFYLPLTRAFDGVDAHWFEDFCKVVEEGTLPRLPRKKAKLRIFVLDVCFVRCGNDETLKREGRQSCRLSFSKKLSSYSPSQSNELPPVWYT